jgi:hypothetical protein
MAFVSKVLYMIANIHHSCAPPEDTIGGLTGKDAPMPT